MTQNKDQSQSKTSNQRRILPPQVDQDVTFGIMWIRIGKLKLTRGKGPLDNKVLIQFWGQKQPVFLQTKSNPLNINQSQTMVEYDIKCPITYFKDYLMDMKKNLRLQVQNVGKVDFDITKFLKANIDLSSRYVFDHFKGAFQIIGQHNRKIGTVQLQMACNFNPQLTALQLGQQEESQNVNDHQHQQKKIAQQNPQLFNQFYQDHAKSIKKDTQKKQQYKGFKDDRIPNSLCKQMSVQKFNPALYFKEQPKSNQISEHKVPQSSPRNPNIVMTKVSQKQRKLSQANQPVKDQQFYNFPTIAKVLTYSNLRLTKGYDEVQESSKMQHVQKGDRESINIQKMDYYEYEKDKNESERSSKVSAYKIQQQKQLTPRQKLTTQKQYQRPKTPIQGISKEDVLSDIKRLNSQSDSNLLEQDKEILSRVVNLDDQLKKSQVKSPQKQKNKEIYQDSPIKMKAQQLNPIHQKQNDIRPITQSNHPDKYLQKQFKQTPQMKYPVTQQPFMMKKIKPSSLVLNLLIEIQTQSIKFLKKKQKFNLIHRPYGCKERIKLGPKFETDKITIMCPVSEQLVLKMDKLPFIVQFWGAVTNQFLGFIKIDLNKIKKGFMLQGRLNEIAIKSNLMPIIIQKGEIWIENVNGQRSGECSIYAGIGTSAQIALYLNTERRVGTKQQQQGGQQEKKKQVKKDKRTQKKQQRKQNLLQQKLDLSNGNVLLTNFLYFIDMNSNRNIQQLAEFMRKKEVTNEEFEDFILHINPQQQKVKQLVHIFKHCVPFSIGEQKFIKTSTLKTSFDQFKQMQQSTIKEFNKVNKFIQKRVSQQTKDEITKASSFNIIQKQKLRQIYINNLNSNPMPQTMIFKEQKQAFECYYLSFFEQFVNLKTIFSQQKLNSFYQPAQKLIMQQVINDFLQVLLKKSISLDYLQICLKETDGQQDLSKKLQRFCIQHLTDQMDKMTLWYWVCLCHQDLLETQHKEQKFIERLRQQEGFIHQISVIKEKIASQQAHESQRKAFESLSKQKPSIQPKPSPKAVPQQQNGKQKQQRFRSNQSMGSITDSNIHNILNQKQTSNLIKDLININNQSVQQTQQNKQQYSNVLIQKENVDVSNSQLSQNVQKEKQQKYFQHVFEIKGVELFLQHPKQGEYVIIYKFPYEQENIGSKKIRILPNKHRYAINLYGQHRISIEGDIKEYLNEIPLKFELIKIEDSERQGVQLQGDLHCDELFTGEQNASSISQDRRKNAQNRVVLLFGQDVENVQGKVKIQVYYESKQSTNPMIGKQTVYNLFLPKVGFVNFAFQLKLEEDKIKSQFQLQHNEEYYVSLTVDMFYQSKTLRPHYPPLVSPLHSHLDEEIMFNTSQKLTLNPNILSYIKENSCHVSLNLIYYSKSKGNYEKKQTTFATLKIPLFSLIQSQGISGNYAFKNKYGMFIALCKTYINYDKYEKKSNLSQSNSHLSMMNTFSQKQNKFNTYWVMIHFKELINFQQNVQTTFVKFQTIMNAQKFQTQKIHLSQDPLLLFNDFIVIPLNEEQFFSTKIIPISILFDQNQKFAMDISMRPILRKLSKQNYSVNGGYFLVVDENSQMTKMRVGARVIVFKGSGSLQPFINAYANNINMDVLGQIDLKRDLENYNKLLELFKGELKLSKKSFEQCLRQILVNKNERLPLELMSSQLLYRLDLTPIVAENEQEVDSLVRNIDGVTGERRLIQFVQQNEYRLTNFHVQILGQYSFESLWSERIDKNVDYFNLNKQIDVLTLARKIKVIDSNNNNNRLQHQQQQRRYRELRIRIEKGSNFHYLYNGIKPNVLIKIPQLSYQSKLKARSSQPQFNQSLREIVDQQNEMIYRNLIIEVYHVSTGRKGQQQQILIGEGKLNVYSSINLSKPIKPIKSKSEQKSVYGDQKPIYCQQKPVRVIISSRMSSKMKATLQISLKFSIIGENQIHKIKPLQQEQLRDASRIQEMIKDINKDMDDKRHMFDQSSDDDDY